MVYPIKHQNVKNLTEMSHSDLISIKCQFHKFYEILEVCKSDSKQRLFSFLSLFGQTEICTQSGVLKVAKYAFSESPRRIQFFEFSTQKCILSTNSKLLLFYVAKLSYFKAVLKQHF